MKYECGKKSCKTEFGGSEFPRLEGSWCLGGRYVLYGFGMSAWWMEGEDREDQYEVGVKWKCREN